MVQWQNGQRGPAANRFSSTGYCPDARSLWMFSAEGAGILAPSRAFSDSASQGLMERRIARRRSGLSAPLRSHFDTAAAAALWSTVQRTLK